MNALESCYHSNRSALGPTPFMCTNPHKHTTNDKSTVRVHMQCRIKTTHSTLDNSQNGSVVLQYVAWRKKETCSSGSQSSVKTPTKRSVFSNCTGTSVSVYVLCIHTIKITNSLQFPFAWSSFTIPTGKGIDSLINNNRLFLWEREHKACYKWSNSSSYSTHHPSLPNTHAASDKARVTAWALHSSQLLLHYAPCLSD